MYTRATFIVYEVDYGTGYIDVWDWPPRPYEDYTYGPSDCLWIVPGTIDPMED